MCGISGIISAAPQREHEAAIAEMVRTQTHRGPDGSGIWSDQSRRVHLGHNRLSILDLSESGSQPMRSLDGRFTLTFNGEIYNYIELRKKCLKQGSEFLSETDSEVIIEYYRHYGLSGLKDLRGMWAFGLYDSGNDELLLCRDPFGIKPLHYAVAGGNLFFASEIKALHAANVKFRNPDLTSIELFQNNGTVDVGQWTFFEDVKRFPEASYALLDMKSPTSVKSVKYWEPNCETRKWKYNEALETLEALLEQSVERHMRSDVPVAFCLSGGLDSSCLVGLAAGRSQEGQMLESFTTSFPDDGHIDETRWASMAAKWSGIQPNWINPSDDDVLNMFQDVIRYHDEPFQSLRVYAQNAIYQGVAEGGFKVCIDGQGADEIFGGYGHHLDVNFQTMLDRKNYLKILTEAPSYYTRHGGRLKNDARSLMRNLLRRGSQSKSSPQIPTNLSDCAQSRLENIWELRSSSSIEEYLFKELTVSSIPRLLRNCDRSSMMYSVESRVPYLDVDLVEYALSLPVDLKIRRGISKFILRKVAEKRLPHKLVYRRDKLGYGAPEGRWLNRLQKSRGGANGARQWRDLVINEWKQLFGILDGVES